MLEAITLSGIVACVLSILCGALNLLRGVHAIESVLQVSYSKSCINKNAAASFLSFVFLLMNALDSTLLLNA